MNKRGQATIFVIIAIAIVGIILVISLFPGTIRFISGAEIPPSKYLGECVEEDIREAVKQLSLTAGYIEPDGVIEHAGEEYKYLCYTSEYYETCAVQQPFVKNNFENQLEELIKPKAERCAEELIKEFENRGYEVNSGIPSANVSIIPGKIKTEISIDMTVTNEGTSQEVEGYASEIDSKMYELLFIAQSIVDYESELGDTNIETYISYYPSLSMNKLKLEDGSTIYKLENVITEEEFRFASRSLAWPPGYGII